MEVTVKRMAMNDIEKLPNDLKNFVLEILFRQIPVSYNINDSHGIDKLKGFKDLYRIRIRNYRIGIKINDSKMTIIRVLHRREIYKYFS